MFIGAVPAQAVEQITRVVPFGEWREVFVGCSGSFRFDRAVREVHKSVTVHSNDVSLLSCSLGALATGAEFPIAFTGRLAFIEPLVSGQTFLARVAAVEVALTMATYKGENAFAQAHFAHYQERFADFLKPATARLVAFLDGLRIASFFAGDFREQGRRAAAAGGGIFAFPPTYKMGYERQYKFVDQNTDWQRPAYDIWDPTQLESWIDDLDKLGVRYCVLTDHALEHHEPVTAFHPGGSSKPVYSFADRARSSIRGTSATSQPFRYRPLDPKVLSATSVVEIITASSGQMNFLKDHYLSKGIAHGSGNGNFLVMIDGNLAGGFILKRNRVVKEGFLYLLCDFAISPKSRVSKLVAMLATSEVVVHRLEMVSVRRLTGVYTTASTDRPVSMKYRGIFDLVGREPGKLLYASKVRRQTPAEIYAEWFARFVGNARAPGEAGGPEAAGQERPLHEGDGVRAPGGEHPAGRLPDQLAAGTP
jgi:hypothetical protein